MPPCGSPGVHAAACSGEPWSGVDSCGTGRPPLETIQPNAQERVNPPQPLPPDARICHVCNRAGPLCAHKRSDAMNNRDEATPQSAEASRPTSGSSSTALLSARLTYDNRNARSATSRYDITRTVEVSDEDVSVWTAVRLGLGRAGNSRRMTMAGRRHRAYHVTARGSACPADTPLSAALSPPQTQTRPRRPGLRGSR